MNFAQITTYLRDMSARYGGIKDHLAAAGALDKAASAFLKNQDMESLTALNGAAAHAWRLCQFGEMKGEPVVARTGIEPVLPT